MLHDFKLFRSTISELITSLHNQETAKTNFTNNCSMLIMSTESTINYHKKTIAFLYSITQSLSLPTTTLLYSLLLKKSRRLIHKSKKAIQKLLEQNHMKKEKKALLNHVIGHVIGQPNSSKKLDSLDQSGILLCHKQL